MLNSLNIAQSGLYASKFAIENIMNNIANEATPGYKKRVANIAELSHTDSRQAGRGVQVSAASRITNMFMYDTLISQQSKSSYYKEGSTMLGDIESFFYEGDNSGFSSDFDRYVQALENLRVSPQNQTNKNILAEAGNTVASDLQTIYKNLEDKQESLKKTAKENVEAINGFLYDIGEVNQQMGQSAEVSNDLLDRRDYLESKLAEYVDIEVDRTNDYQLKIGGQVAVRYNTNIHNVKAVENYTKQIDIYKDFSGTGDFTYSFEGLASVTASDIDGLVTNINASDEMKKVISASKDADGNLVISSKTDGITGAFNGVLSRSNNELTKDPTSQLANDDFHIEIFDTELNLKGGMLKTKVDNLDTEGPNNQIQKYKDMLDNFAKALGDMTSGYISDGNGSYNASGMSDYLENYNGTDTFQSVGLFKGSSVKTLSFDSSVLNDISQNDLDYLAGLQWTEGVKFADGTQTSFNKYYQILQVAIASDKESIDFKQSTQEAVTQSLKSNYDKITKVDKDEELILLTQFQAAYQASAKLVTIVDELMQTILGMKR
jgi:flagellar hook-associated protein 1 FlgK